MAAPDSVSPVNIMTPIFYMYNVLVKSFIWAIEHGYVPDILIRTGIKFLLWKNIVAHSSLTLEQQVAKKQKFVDELKGMPVAINTDEANEQHYEVPTSYYLLCLGKHLKYSSCLYKNRTETLSQAEENMLSLYVERANISDGQSILELGCGWGSFCLYAAARFPNSSVTAVSNSNTQREFITLMAQQRGLKNLQVITANMVNFQAPSTYDRVVSIEMFEHMKNYKELLRRVSTWLNPGGHLFVHIFVHKTMAYHFQVQSEEDWMSKYFFTGGTMPSLDLLQFFQEDLNLSNIWYVNGVNYSRTLEDWLVKHDANQQQIVSAFGDTYGKSNALVWFNRWRIFYLACSELFRYSRGEEWGVAHYLFEKK